MLGGFCTDLLVIVTLLFLTQTGTQCRAENDITSIKLPDWRRDSVCSLNCSFDRNFCSWNQMISDAFDWTWQNGSTPTLRTGPSSDHTGDGHYLYIEASTVSHGDTARLISSECSSSGSHCLQFWYHMYGSADTMGLHLYLLQDKKADAIWWKRNDQGNIWHLAQVDLTVTGAFQIIIEGRRGSNKESDVAIDDVTLYHGQCSELSGVMTTHPPKPDGNVTARPAVNVTDRFPVTTWPPVANATVHHAIETTTSLILNNNVTGAAENRPPQSVCQLNCNFEKGLCQWHQLIADAFDWTRKSGSTPTPMTGPSSDHTTEHGHYLYIEANNASHGDTARLISSDCSASGPQCLQFWYHMYGSANTMGLHLYLLQDNKANAIWWKRNDQGNMWHLAEVDLTVKGAFQVIIEGRRGSNEESDVAIDDITLHNGHCSVCQLKCNFEKDLCQWKQLITDAFDWTRHSGSTPTLMTGPSSDHTTGHGHYLYIEANNASYGDTARLISSECSASGPKCLQFWYHMHGLADTMGLHLYLLQDKKADAIWWKRNDQGNMWHLAEVDLTVKRAFQIIIEGRRGSNEESDIAIDDVTLYNGHCSELSGVVTTHPPKPEGNATIPPSITSSVTAVTELPVVNVTDQFPTTAMPPVANATLLPVNEATTNRIMNNNFTEDAQNRPAQSVCQFNCNFEKHLCQWRQLVADAFDWTRQSSSTPTIMTGPSSDHTTGYGHYLYIEANNASYGDTARLISSECSASGPKCLQFWYHMYGSADTMGLHLYLLQDKKADAIWWKRNDQGNIWHLAEVDLTVKGAFQIIIEGRRGSNEESDVAIDDVTLYNGHCSVCQLNCNFEKDLCQWRQLVTDVFDWTRQSGSTPTIMTGPSSDHSTGYGHYLYIEANNASYGDTARLISSECSASGPKCLQFWYHMHGSADTMGLHLYLLQDKKADAIWWKRNDQGNMWHLAEVDLTVKGAFQIIFEGRRGSNEESDVAIDDVTLYNGHCSELSGVVTTHSPKPEGNATIPPSITPPVTAVTELPAVNVTDQFPATDSPPVANATVPPVNDATTNRIMNNNLTEDAQDRPPHSVCQLNCNFEKDLCQWKQLITDAFDWTRQSGSTLTLMTGPSSDHTTGHGHYLYTEANSASHGDTARLISSECSATGPQCLHFWYHMYGSAETMGLHVYLLQDKKANAISWIRNNQGNMWRLAQVDFTTTGSFQILFEGRRGSNDQSDVAFDDISLYGGRCSDLTNPASTTTHSVTTEGSEPPTENLSTQPQTSTIKTTADIIGSETQTTRPTTTKNSNPNASTEMPGATVTIEPQTTATPHPSSTNHPVVEGTEDPGPEPTTEELTAPITYPQSTARPIPQTTQTKEPTTGSHPKTSVAPETPTKTPPGTAGPQSTTNSEPQPPNATIEPQATMTIKPQHPNESQPATTVNPQPPTTTESSFDECTINGDPGYRTFDNMKHDFEGEHSYVLVQTKNLPSNLQDVYIEGINTPDDDDRSSEEDHNDDDDDDNGDDESNEHEEHHRLQSLKIQVYNHTVEFKKLRKLFVDGKRTKTPVSPSLGLKIKKHSAHIYLNTDFGLSVKFDGQSAAEITLPRTYKQKVGGLCGNYDGRIQNDRMKPDGTVAKTVQEFGESWRV